MQLTRFFEELKKLETFMEYSPYWKAYSRSSDQEFPAFIKR
jgi:hypothetical protein